MLEMSILSALALVSRLFPSLFPGSIDDETDDHHTLAVYVESDSTAPATCSDDSPPSSVVSFARLPSDVLLAQILAPYFDFQEAMDLRQVERALKRPAEKCAVEWLGRRFPSGLATLAEQQPSCRPVYSLSTAIFVQLELDRPRPSPTEFLSRQQLLLRYSADCDCDDRIFCDCDDRHSWRALCRRECSTCAVRWWLPGVIASLLHTYGHIPLRMRERQRRAQQQYAREEQRARKRGGAASAAPLPFSSLTVLVAGTSDDYNSPRHGFDEHRAYNSHQRMRLHLLPEGQGGDVERFVSDER